MLESTCFEKRKAGGGIQSKSEQLAESKILLFTMAK